MLPKRFKIILIIFFIIAAVIASALLYLYQKGGIENYKPPAARVESARTQVLNDLTSLSQAIEAYQAKNLKLPESLDQLQPEFIDKMPLEPVSEKPYDYKSDGLSQYRIHIANPTAYGFKELFVENGKIFQTE